MSEPPRFRIGADENGLGPRLGPMLVTAVLAEVTEGGHKVVERRARGAMKGRLGDSKALVSFGDVALGEAWARALVEREGAPAKTPAEIVAAVSLDDQVELERPCPGHVRGQCWSTEGEALVADPALVAAVHKDLARLDKAGVSLRVARSVIVCTRRLNDAVDVGKSRFAVDLHAMERLVLSLGERAAADVLAVCGKVGGLRQYEDAFGPLAGRLRVVLEEKKQRSAYHFPGLGEIRFVMDADASDKLVSIASLVGKYLRELLMKRVARHYQAADPELPDASGYHDPVTERFVQATALARNRQKIPEDCFERRALGR